VIVCVPTVKEEVVNVATPPDNMPWPNGVVPSTKLTVPVGVPDDEETVAVNMVALVLSTGLTLLASATAGVTGAATALTCTEVEPVLAA
jgi:hypothetical protein